MDNEKKKDEAVNKTMKIQQTWFKWFIVSLQLFEVSLVQFV